MSPRPLVGPRLQRVLAVIPWVLAHPGVTIAELAERFEIPEPDLERDLALAPPVRAAAVHRRPPHRRVGHRR